MSENGSSHQRRRFLTTTLCMGGGLVAGYGALVAVAGRFLYSRGRGAVGWMFVCRSDALAPGESVDFVGPTGSRVVITRRDDSGGAEDFLALSSTCPHLGCQVHWEAHRDRFFCPCHNGTFDPQGNPTGGPPADAGQSLPHYPLLIENGLLFIEVPLYAVGEPESDGQG